MNLREEILDRLNRYGVEAQERFSQNFLIDQKARDAIVSSVPLNQCDGIVEIGPGLGSLTEMLVSTGKEVTAIDFDKDMIKVLKGEFHQTNLHIVQGDFLKQDLQKFHVKHNAYIGNLPYSISRDILHKVLTDPCYPYFGFMVQKELGDKLIFEEGDPENNAYSAYFALRGNLTELMALHPSSFYPSPKVDSVFLVFTPQDEGKYADEKVFQFLKTLYTNPKKNLNNNLKRSPYFETVQKNLNQLSFDLSKRPHQLSIAQIREVLSILDL